jgi:hypothetical protein
VTDAPQRHMTWWYEYHQVDPVCSPKPGIAEGMNERWLRHISLCPAYNLHVAGTHLLRKSFRKSEKENSVATAVQEMNRLRMESDRASVPALVSACR